MFRNLFTVFLAFSVALLEFQPAAFAQYTPAPSPQSYPAQSYSSQYPQTQQYPPPQQYPQAQQYPQPGQGQPDTGEQDVIADRQHGVARLSIVQGDVNVKRADSGELVAAAMNIPLMAQDHLQTASGSRAEVELDSANLARLAPDSDLGFADLQYHRYQLQLGMGTMIYRVLRDSDAQVEIDTPSIAIRPMGQDEIRISVLDDGTTQITLRYGGAEIYGPRGSQRLQPGQSILVRGNPADPEFQVIATLGRDQFDDWSAGRDRELLGSQSYNYVNRDIYGADDLDRYGNWVPSQYGQVWEPQAPGPDWSPYSNGEWAYEPYYGWTWVDAAPWGWAPYHYGRWFFNAGYGWCWWPGLRAGFQFWSPALVGFFGWGAGLGWVALAPFEIFHAWWGHGWRGGYGYGFGVHASFASMYRNAAIRGGAMTAAYNGFGGPHQHFAPATRAQLSNASLLRSVPVTPNRASYQFSSRQAMANPRLASATNRQFFHQQSGFQVGNQAASGSRFGAAQQNGRAVSPNVQRTYSTQSRPSTSGWQRFGDPGTSSSFRSNFSGGQEESGWHRFGQPQSPSAQQGQRVPSYGGYNQGSAAGRSSYSVPRYNSAPHYSAPAAPHYSAPSVQHYSAPPAPHYSAPSSRGGGGGSSRGGGGGGHSSSGGHRGR